MWHNCRSTKFPHDALEPAPASMVRNETVEMRIAAWEAE